MTYCSCKKIKAIARKLSTKVSKKIKNIISNNSYSNVASIPSNYGRAKCSSSVREFDHGDNAISDERTRNYAEIDRMNKTAGNNSDDGTVMDKRKKRNNGAQNMKFI